MHAKINFFVNKIEEWFTILFICVSIFVLIFLTLALFLTWINQFTTLLILVSSCISLVSTLLLLPSIKKDIRIIPRLNIAVLMVIFIICLILAVFPHDSFGGRDEGTYAGLATILSKHHSISVPSYLYKAPLLYESPEQKFSFTTPVHIVWLAVQKLIFGTGWMLRSNVVLVFLGLCSLFLTSSLITRKSLALTTVLLLTTSMPFLWFSRETMTENMAFYLLWFLVLSLFLFVKTRKYYFLASLFISSWLLAFTRNEGLFMQIPILIVLVSLLSIKKVIPRKQIFFISLIYIFLIVASFIVNNMLLPITENQNIVNIATHLDNNLGDSTFVRLGDKISLFTFQMVSKQNLSLALYSCILTILSVMISKQKDVKDRILYIGLLCIISVEFLKLVNPSATLEQPWMYRRYLYALLPFGYLSFSILLNRLVKRKVLLLIISCVLVINIMISAKIITHKNNWQITEKIELLTRDITKKDIIIIDGQILGNYKPLSYIALNNEIRNLYNWWIEIGDWQPKEKKYQGVPYTRLFLLSNKEYIRYKNFKLVPTGTVDIESKQLKANCKLGSLRKELGFETQNFFRLPYPDVIKYCSKVDNDIINIKEKIFLYEMEYNYGQL